MTRHVKSLYYTITKDGAPVSYLFGTLHLDLKDLNFAPWDQPEFDELEQVICELEPGILKNPTTTQTGTVDDRITAHALARAIPIIGLDDLDLLHRAFVELFGDDYLKKFTVGGPEFNQYENGSSEARDQMAQSLDPQTFANFRAYENMVHAYHCQDLSVFQRKIDALSLDEQNLLLNARNRAWIDKIKHHKLLDRKSLIAVGCSHLIGSNSLIKLLQKEGYCVEPSECPRDSLQAEQCFDKVMTELTTQLTALNTQATKDGQAAETAAGAAPIPPLVFRIPPAEERRTQFCHALKEGLEKHRKPDI